MTHHRWAAFGSGLGFADTVFLTDVLTGVESPLGFLTADLVIDCLGTGDLETGFFTGRLETARTMGLVVVRFT